ncbi:MAG TPA: threonine/serine dehydratase [Planctomycetota bacterium]|nr:threonine/serine dehydratase [Planctomycetota bacterium]
MVTLEDVRRAAKALSGSVERTPLVRSDELSRELGAEVFLKLESLQRTGAFKIRGATYAVTRLSPEARRGGVITFSAGNHGRGLAHAAAAAGIPCTVVMPAGANPVKVEATRALGAEIVFAANASEAFALVQKLGAERGLHFVSPFEDDDVIAGQGTVGLEILEDLPDVDLLVVPVGGSGLASGIALVAKSLRPSARLVATEPAGADKLRRALEAKRVVRLERVQTVADGLAAPFVGERNLRILEGRLDGLVVLSEGEILAGLRFLVERCRVLAEPAGAASTAALLTRRAGLQPGEKVVAVVTGGNLDLARLPEFLGKP